MKAKKNVKAVGTLLSFIIFAVPAFADRLQWAFDFESPGAGISVVGRIFTTGTLNVLGNFDVTAITGTVNGTPIGSLLPNPNQPFVFNAPNGNLWDNNLIPTAPFVTTNGIGFNFGNDQFVLFSGVTGDPLSEGIFMQNEQESAIGTLSVSQVPEPSTGVLLLCGLFGLSIVARRLRGKRNAAQVYYGNAA